MAAHLPLRPAFAELALLAAVESDEPGARDAWSARFGDRPPPALAPAALTARLVREATAIIYGPRHKPAEKRFMAKHLYRLAADRGDRQGSLGLAKIYWYGETNAKACAEHALAAGSLPEAIRLTKLCQR